MSIFWYNAYSGVNTNRRDGKGGNRGGGSAVVDPELRLGVASNMTRWRWEGFPKQNMGFPSTHFFLIFWNG